MKRYKLAAQGANDGLWDWDLKTNLVLERWKALSAAATKSVQPQMSSSTACAGPAAAARTRRTSGGNNPIALRIEHRIRHKSGAFRWSADSRARRCVLSGEPFAAAFAVSGRHRQQDRRCITGLPNRVLLVDASQAYDRRRDGSTSPMLFLDLDGFKMVNDGMGHLGDRLLRPWPARLRQSAPGRHDYAGDESAPAPPRPEHATSRDFWR